MSITYSYKQHTVACGYQVLQFKCKLNVKASSKYTIKRHMQPPKSIKNPTGHKLGIVIPL